ncbi:hypothetical protein [Gloeocapsa sp. PCC 73106]|uniref:hypothetical protein n=1 Tax=Gloeocapsa sp. PCC 73106 TaxID=102232 RepID=UPI0002AC960D|nr:hypothetical protein [Gloeocapsa sp. PCC 73106]ELR97157.1 hypothetical protein GLO73106DRAFT_00009620 [Gloeocapsa sp. PCC 73106]
MRKDQAFSLVLATFTSLVPFLTINLFTPNSVQVTLAAESDPATAKRWTDTAKFIAGMTVDADSHLAQFQQTSTWQNHQQFIDNAWSQLDSQQLTQVRKWSETELGAINQSNPVLFYPFSGPDFLYAYTFFPQAKEYVLVGLEPIGSIPSFTELSEAEKDAKLMEIRNSLHAILQWSFFRTNDMKVDMAQQGVLPYLFLFLARTNNQILDVEYVGVDQDAKIQKYVEGMVPGVRITFIPQGETDAKTLYYFSTDLSDDGLAKTPQFLAFIKTLEAPVTYLKAASYLMYYDYFSQIRNAILAQSQALLQDDSGMPVKHFSETDWELTFYGTYTAPIPLFENMYQPDLRAIYQNNANIKPLNFGVGYKFGVNESNLMLGIKK